MLDKLLDLIWPRTCEVCGNSADRPGRHVCSDCLMRLPFIPTDGCCRRCGRDVAKLDGEFLCEECRTDKPHFDRAASVLRYEGEARRMMLGFKFNRWLWLRYDFIDWLEATTRARFRVDEIGLVLPVPTTLWHRFDRGYNQADYLASGLARRLGLRYDRWALRRTGSPARQGGLKGDERKQNVLDTFVVTGHGRSRLKSLAAPATVLVVDDVMTTGSTLSECARTIKAVAPSVRVWCVSLCRPVHIA